MNIEESVKRLNHLVADLRSRVRDLEEEVDQLKVEIKVLDMTTAINEEEL